MTPKLEAMLLPIVQEYLSDEYGSRATELPFFEHRIDLYGYCENTTRTIAVELKLRDWRRALQQALLYQLCSDYVFIAVPVETAKRVDLDLLREHGIGLLSIDDNRCVEQLPAVPSQVLNPNYKAQYTALIQE